MNPNELLSSGLLEQLVLGQLSPGEARRVEGLAWADPQARARLQELRAGIEQLARDGAVVPPAALRSKVLSTIASLEQQQGVQNRPPILHPASKLADYERWLNDPALVRPVDAGPLFYVPVHQDERAGTAILWLTEGAPEETHTDELEKFLVVEGSCEIMMQGRVYALKPGDQLSIPLHTPHTVKVTSEVPCKLVLQRVAA